MTSPHDKHSAAWIEEKVALEDEFGPLGSAGALGGVIARARRAARGHPTSRAPAAQRARERVRRTFQPLRVDEAA